MTRALAAPSRLGVAYAWLLPLVLGGELALFLQRGRLLSMALDGGGSGVPKVLLAGAAALLLAPLLGLGVVRKESARPRRSLARARMLLTGWSGALHVLANLAFVVLAARSESARSLAEGARMVGAAELGVGAQVAAVLSVATAVTGLAGALSCFSLIAAETRRLLWIGVDLMLVVAVAWAVASLPVRPPEHAPDLLVQPLIRHVITTIALLRLLVRALPFLLDSVERTGLLPLVAARHLRSKKSGFLAAISLLSVLAVTVSCMALTLTLSVMGGFRNDLKRKILGNNAHVVIDVEHGHIERWHDVLKRVERTPHVTGAAPFVSGEVMLSSASNLATAVLRGIEPERIGSVNDLPRNLQSGSLEYLTTPEKLLDLPASAMRGGLLGPGSGSLRIVGQGASDGGTEDDGADAGVAAPGAAEDAPGDSEAAALQARIERTLDEIEAMLEEQTAARKSDAAPRDVLPGIVIGKELARALRLYVGDEVNVVAPLGTLGPTGPMPKARPFRVAGIFYSGMYEYDMKFTYVALPTAQRFLNVNDAISGIELRVDDLERAPEVASSVRGMVGDRKELRVRDWQEQNSRLFGALALEKLAMFIALGIAVVVASFCIAGTLTLMVQEKGREVAILKAMGTTDRDVVGVFVIEGGLIGVLGASLGLFLGFMTCFAAEHFGIRMNPEVYYIDRLPVHVDPTEFALTGVAAVLVCLIITVYPALLASRLRPVDALRYE